MITHTFFSGLNPSCFFGYSLKSETRLLPGRLGLTRDFLLVDSIAILVCHI